MLERRVRALIGDWGRRLQADPLAARAIRRMHERRVAVAQSTLAAVQRENIEFQQASSGDFTQQPIEHLQQHFAVLLAIGDGAELGEDPFRFVRGLAVIRAQQQFPLAASLHAYRIGHKGVLTAVREAVPEDDESHRKAMASLLTLSDFLMEYTDVISTILTEACVAEEKLLNTRRARGRLSLLDDLLRGVRPRDADAEAPVTSAASTSRNRSPSASPVPPSLPAAARPTGRRRSARSAPLSTALARPGLGRLVDIRDEEMIALLCGGARGVSLDVHDIAELPQAYLDAQHACEFAGPGRSVVHFADIDLVEFLPRRPDAAAFRLLAAWAEELQAADRKKAGKLARTIRTFTDCSLNVKVTARRLRLHTNTLYFRLNRIKQLTGVDPRNFAGATLLLTTLRLLESRPRLTPP
ncbi:MAG TPA: helix-turn-helix domain-containing protein [Stellaceae bacterium]|nr:helix-turn-helix domain-containing protein [Stellaceae bacterium]